MHTFCAWGLDKNSVYKKINNNSPVEEHYLISVHADFGKKL
jgi:hypothetical protein